MGSRLVICDTGVLSRYILEAPAFVELLERIGLPNVRVTPVIRIEFLNWLSGFRQLTRPARAVAFRFIKAQHLLHLSENISELAVELSDKHINSKPGDTLIAATALYHNLPVCTINKTDFRQLGVVLFE